MTNQGQRQGSPIGMQGNTIRPTNPMNGSMQQGQQQNMYGMQQNNQGMGGYGMQPVDGLSLIRNTLAGNGQGPAGGFDWNNADQTSFLTDNQRNALNSLGGDEGNQEGINKQNALMTAGQMMARFAQDCHYKNINGLYRFFDYGRMNFLRHDNPNAPEDPIRNQFYQWMMKFPKLQQRVALNSSILAGYQIAQRIMHGVDFNVKDLEHWFTIAVNNILYLEMMNWFSKTQEGQRSFTHISQQEQNTLNNLNNYKAAIAQAFMFMSIDNPYGEIDPHPTMNFSADASPINYQSQAQAGTPHFGPVFESQGTFGSREEAMHMASMSSRLYRQDQTYQPPVNNNTQYQDFSFGPGPSLRDDYRNIDFDNRKEFNLDVFKEVGDTGYFMVDPLIWNHISKLFIKQRNNQHNEVNFPGVYNLIRFDNPHLREGWTIHTVRFPGANMRAVLEDPSILLPALQQTENNEIEISSLSSSAFIKTPEPGDDYEPLFTKPLGKSPTVVVNDEVIASDSSAEIETDLNVLFETLNPETDEFFGVAVPAVNYTKFLVEDPEEIAMVYNHLPYLVKGAGHKPKDFFALLDNLEYSFINYLRDEELETVIKSHILEATNRWLVECRGFGATKDDAYYYALKGDLFEAVSSLREFIATNDPDTLSALKDSERCARLLDRCRLFANKEDRIKFASSGTNSPIAKLKESKTLIISREVVITRVTNVETPLLSGSSTAFNIHKANAPELFALVGKVYGRATESFSNGADMLISYEKDNTLWLFITNDFDNNVATLRQVYRNTQLVNHRF